MAAALGLSTYRWNNNLKSFLLLAVFPFLLLLLLGILVYLFAFFLLADHAGHMRRQQFLSVGLDPVTGTLGPFDFTCAGASAYWPYVAAAAVVWLVIAYLFNDAMIHRATGARPVARADQPRLYNLLENLCISRGLAMPRLYLIDTEAMNAYASGIDQRSYAITVTSGLLAGLDDAELEAVLAHELTHIIDRDVRLLIVTILFVGVISFIAQLFWRGLRVFSSRSRVRISGGPGALFVLAAAAVAGVGYLLALVLRFAISREREYLADAGSVELTKRPEALISALRKIAQNPEVPHVPSEVRQMFIENPPTLFGLVDLFATHPPIEDRIRTLERLGGIAPPEPGARGALPPQRPRALGRTFAGLTIASGAYAIFLLIWSNHNPSAVEALASAFSPLTAPVASVLPIALLADYAANPALGISPALIRHLFPALVIVNSIAGMIALGFSGRLSAFDRAAFAGGGRGPAMLKGLLMGLHVCGVALAIYVLFLEPTLGVVLDWRQRMGLFGLMLGAISPALFYFCLCRIVALMGAQRRA